MDLVSIEEIRDAASRVKGVAVRTPLLEQSWAPLWLKPENLQPIGAFKVRGAHNAIAALDEEQRARGVCAFSSGNHAQAVAYSAKRFGIPATIIVPDVAPRAKVEATKALGAEVIEVPIDRQESSALAVADERSLTMIPPFDHRDVIAGQGTVGLEIAEDLPDAGVVLVPLSGGGLASGVGAALKALLPGAKVIGVEPELAGDTAEGLRAGRRIEWPMDLRARTSADGLRAQPSDLTFAHLQAVLDDVVTVSEAEIREAVRTLAHRARLLAEPSGATATAAFLSHRDALPPGKVVSVVSGGNMDPATLAALLA